MTEPVINFFSRKKEWGEFSNFYEAEIIIEGVTWPTSEHYFQAQKFPSRPEVQQEIRNSASPSQAKKLGRNNSGLRSDWEQVKDNVMRDALRAKFNQHQNLKDLLLSTGNAKLVEDSPTDDYWGTATRRDGTEGFNKLGILLMEIREEIKGNERDLIEL